MLRQTRLTILLSLNAAAIVIAGVMIAGAIGLNDGLSFKVVAEDSDVVDGELVETALLNPEQNVASSMVAEEVDANYQSTYKALTQVFSTDDVASGELWNEESIAMYETADIDLCAGGGLTDLGEMYWKTSNTDVISGFYSTARTWLGYDSSVCRYPKIAGTGVTTVTAGTYDGLRRDSLMVAVLPVPEEAWKREVLELVNTVRTEKGLGELSWGATCAEAAQLRAEELVQSYSHTRPNGSSWSTVCVSPAQGGVSGENLAAGNAAVSPATVVAQWMNSADHRANILNPSFTKLAVGFVFAPDTQYKTYWSQFFSNY